jgi:hypothetical protein
MKLRKVAVKKWIDPECNSQGFVFFGTGCYSDEIDFYGYFHKWIFDVRSDKMTKSMNDYFISSTRELLAIIETEEGEILTVDSKGLIFLNEVKKL